LSYPRYWCRKPDCKAISKQKSDLEAEFQQYLTKMRLDPAKAKALPKIAAKAWEARQGSARTERIKLQVEVDAQIQKNGALLNLRMNQELTKRRIRRGKRNIPIRNPQARRKVQCFGFHAG